MYVCSVPTNKIMKHCEVCEEYYKPFREENPTREVELCEDCYSVINEIAEYFRENEGQCLTPAVLKSKGDYFIAASIYPPITNPYWPVSVSVANWFNNFITDKGLICADFELYLLEVEALEKIHYSI